MTVADLCDLYISEIKAGRLLIRGGRTKKASTLRNDISMIELHIKVLLGRITVRA